MSTEDGDGRPDRGGRSGGPDRRGDRAGDDAGGSDGPDADAGAETADGAGAEPDDRSGAEPDDADRTGAGTDRGRGTDAYVHDPTDVGPESGPTPGTGAGVAADDGGDRPPSGAPPAADAVDYRGWLLVAAVFVAFVVVPAFLIVRPPRLAYGPAMRALPVVPAVLLAAVAVWAALGRRD